MTQTLKTTRAPAILAGIADAARDPCCVLGPGLRIAHANRPFAAGLAAARDLGDLVHPDDAARVAAALAARRDGAPARALGVRLRRVDGGWRELELGLCAPDPSGHLLCEWRVPAGRAHLDVVGRALAGFRAEVYALDPATLRFVAANRAARDNLGHGLKALSRMTPLDIAPDLDADALAALFAPLRDGSRDHVHLETRHRRADGSHYDAEVHLQLARDPRPRFVAVILDVTDRKRAEAEARAARRRLELAVEALSDGFALYDAEDRLVICNRRYRDVYPESAEAMTPGARFEDILRHGLAHGQYADAVGREEDWLAERLAAHRAADSSIEQRLGDGRWLRIVERATPDGGRVGLRIDITEQIESRARAERAERRLTDAIKALPAAFLLFDAEGRLVLYNDRLLDLYGTSAPAIRIGATFEDMLRYGVAHGQYPDAVGREEEWLAERLGADAPGRGSAEMRLDDGRWVKAYDQRTSEGGRVGVRVDVTELKSRQTDLMRAACTDPLTGLLNRRGLSEALAALAAEAEPEDRAAVMHIDLDKFKAVNDVHGHDAGDHVLRVCSRILLREMRAGDVVARVGGDEFVAVCRDARAETRIGSVAARLVEALSRPIPYGDCLCHVGASVGVAFWSPGLQPDAEVPLTDADIALNSSKTAGRGRHSLYEPRMRERAVLGAALGQEIREGLERDEFVVHLQPQLDIDGERPVGFEALLRWRHPTRGLLTPGEFMFAAEQAGLMDALDRRALLRTCGAIHHVDAAGCADVKVSVNLSNSRLSDPGIVDDFKWALEACDATPDRFSLEILESTLLDDRAAHVVENVHRFAAAGFAIELDDFGTGHAAIANLRKFPLTRIKIDRTLVTGIDRDEELQLITGAICSLGRGLGLEVLAEGVETEPELDALRRLGCTSAQGFLFAPALPPEDLAAWVRGRPGPRRRRLRSRDAP